MMSHRYSLVLLFLVVFAPLKISLAHEHPAPATEMEELAPIFYVGARIPFTWWHGTQITSGTMQIDEVRGHWVRMHYLGGKTRGWIYPSAMQAIWGQPED